MTTPEREPSSEARELVADLSRTASHIYERGATNAEYDEFLEAKQALLSYIADLEARTGATYTEDGRRHCSTCGTEVEVVSSDEGTGGVVPVEGEVLGRGYVRKHEDNGECESWLIDSVGRDAAPEHLRVALIRDTSREEDNHGN